MAKKRTSSRSHPLSSPAKNPLRMDMVAALAQAPTSADSDPEVEQEAAVVQVEAPVPVDEAGQGVIGVESRAAQPAVDEPEKPRAVPERAVGGSRSRSAFQQPSRPMEQPRRPRHEDTGRRRPEPQSAERFPKPYRKDTVQIKTRVSEEEAQDFEALRIALENRMGVKIRGSQIYRGLLTLALRVEDELDAVAPPIMTRPSTGDRLAMAQFEDALATYLLKLLKRTRRPD